MTKPKSLWPPTRADYGKALLYLVGCIVMMSIAGYLRDQREAAPALSAEPLDC